MTSKKGFNIQDDIDVHLGSSSSDLSMAASTAVKLASVDLFSFSDLAGSA